MSDDDLAIGLLGDVMLGRSVGEALRTRDAAELWDPRLRALLASLDGVVCNLECCISARGTPTTLVPGKPFFFRAPPAAVGALQAIGVRAVTVANNHALDFGADALADTVELLAAAGIAAAGAGPGTEAARRAAVVDIGGRGVALIGATDHPPQYAATATDWGVAYADLRDGPPEWLLDQVATAHAQGHLVIASPHWGLNMSAETEAWQRAAAPALQEAGADLVAGHSAHVFQGVGWTPAGPLLYDLGDALDDYAVDPVLRNDLGVLAIWRPFGGPAALELVGLRLEYARTSPAAGADAEWIAARLERACRRSGTRVTRIGEQRFSVEPV